MSEIQVGQINSTDGSTAITTGAGGTVTLSAALTGTDATLSGGVYLGGTGSANYLDDYEEGTWTPAWSFSTSGSAAITISHATYVKVGNLVVASTRVSTTSVSSPTGTATLTGLPFTSANQCSASIGNAVRFGSNMPNIKGIVSSSLLQFYKNATNDTSNIPLDGSDFLNISGRNIINITIAYSI